MAERGPWLTRQDFAASVDEVSRDLVGRVLHVEDRQTARLDALIVETEAYGGKDDLASHAAFKPGGRAAIMWCDPGSIYVYAAYGMYACLNIVAGERGSPSAVLVRGVWVFGDAQPTWGPGRTTRRLGITLDDQGESIEGPRFRIARRRQENTITATTRVGITRDVERAWRFVMDISDMRPPR